MIVQMTGAQLGLRLPKCFAIYTPSAGGDGQCWYESLPMIPDEANYFPCELWYSPLVVKLVSDGMYHSDER